MRPYHCATCGTPGHNTTTCPVAVEQRRQHARELRGVHLLGIDPGFRCTGFVVLALEADGPRVVELGVVTTKSETKRRRAYQADDDARCISELYDALVRPLRRWRPVAAAVEAPGGFKSSKAAKCAAMAHATVVSLCWAETRTLPLSVQVGDAKLVAGSRSASKDDVAAAVKAELGGAETLAPMLARVPSKKREHVYDAAAVALAAMDSDVVRMAQRLAS